MNVFICYKKCTTCQKAKKWLDENGIEVTERPIVEENPTVEELKRWIELSGLPISRFFNTSGMLYRERGMKDKVKTLPEDELLKILASDGMMVKRPLLIGKDFVLVGFNEAAWKEKIPAK